jgi:sarcosine oxidase
VTCLYTTTANEDFVIDRAGPVVVASPCSGHGFKFAPLVGRLIAEVVDGQDGPERFRLGR